MNNDELVMLQALPLDVKILKSKQRIREWVDYFGEDGVYVSFSGGKDSTVLLQLVRELYPDVPAVFIDTGLEYPEIKQFVKTIDNVETVRPKMSFKQVLEKYGYPIISKEQANYLHDIRKGSETMKNLRLNGNAKGQFKLSKKYYYLIDAPFDISHLCCNVMKKSPAKSYEHRTNKAPFIGTLAVESNLRLQSYRRNGCNAFESSRPVSMPLGFWLESDILNYIKLNNLPISEAYGDVVEDATGLHTTKCDRTGCIFCGFGCHRDKGENRFQRLKRTHPQLHSYCINQLGFGEVLDYINVPYGDYKP